MEWILLYGSCLFFIFCIKIFDFDLKNFLDRYMDKILTFFVIIITFLSIFQKKLEIDISYQTIILIIISFILIYRLPLYKFFLENFDEISIGNTKLKIKSIQSTIQNLANDGILDKNMKGIEEIRKENKENEDETLLYGKFLLNFSKIDSFLNSIEMVKFRNQIVHNGIEEKYEKEELHQIFIDFINIEEKIISELGGLNLFASI